VFILFYQIDLIFSPSLRFAHVLVRVCAEELMLMTNNNCLFSALQEENRKLVLSRIEAASADWAPSQAGNKGELSIQFLQRCTFPRCFLTANDAVYCARFAQLLHERRTSGWYSLVYYDRLLSDVTCTVTSCTANEARRYGRFLHETLSLLSHWHSDPDVFKKECGDCPGFRHKV
jgi:THO complex subunit 2